MSIDAPCAIPGCASDRHIDQHCTICGNFLGYPNVRRARTETEQLDARYAAAVALTESNGCTNERQTLEVLTQNARIIHTDTAIYLYQVFARGDSQLSGVQRQTDAGIRAVARLSEGSKRIQADAALYSDYGRFLVFATVAPGLVGSISYGEVHVEFDEGLVSSRATVCEENIYRLRERPELAVGLLPAGYISLLHERHKLSVIKNASVIRPDMTTDELASLILSSVGDKRTDRMLEVHLFGPISHKAFKTMRVRRCDIDVEAEYLIQKLTALAGKNGILCEVID
jgi:hypothetical protein